MTMLTKLRGLSVESRRMIVWSIVIILGVLLVAWWVLGVSKGVQKIGEQKVLPVGMPQELQDLNLKLENIGKE